MDNPYTCHNCGTEHDAYVEDGTGIFMHLKPERVKVQCPGCYDSGYTALDQCCYVLDLTTDPPTLVLQ